MLVASDFRRIAREKLKGNWLIAVLAGLVAAVLGGDVESFNIEGTMDVSWEQLKEYISYIRDLEFGAVVLAAVAGIGIITVIWALIRLVIGGAAALGYARFNLGMIDGEEAQIREMASCLDRLWDGFCLKLFSGIFIFLWSLLLVIPGIIAAYRYSMATYIMAENPDMKAMEAIEASKQMMSGNKFRLFCLDLSFIGWDILGMITLGIGMLFVRPYQQAAKAAFYREVSEGR